MLTDLALTTIALPFVLGLAIGGLLSSGMRASWLKAGAIVLSIVVVQFVLDGPPTVPPISSKHRLALVLLAGVPVFAGLGVLLATRPDGLLRQLVLIVVAALILAPLVWIGRTVMFAEPMTDRVPTFAVFFAISSACLAAFAFSAGRLEGGRSASVGAAVLFSSMAGAFIAVSGGYIGMGQMLGVVAALTGGTLLVAYVRFLIGADHAFSIGSASALALGWLCLMFTGVTVLLAPAPSSAALMAQVLVLAVPVAVLALGPRPVPRWGAPILFGLLPGLVAAGAVGLAYSAL